MAKVLPGASVSLSKRLLSGGAWALGVRVAAVVSGLVANALLARLLSPEELGSYFLVVSLVTVSTVIAQLGLGKTVVRLVAESLAIGKPGRARAAVRVVFCYTFLGSIAVAGVLSLGAGRWLATQVFHSQLMAGAMSWVAVMVVITAFRSSLAETFRGFHDIRLASIVGQLAKTLLSAVFFSVVWLAQGHSDLRQVLILSVVAGGTSALVGGLLLHREVRGLGSHGEGLLGYTKVFHMAWPLLIYNLTFFLRNKAGIWVLGALGSSEDVAIYGAASSLVVSVSLPLLVMHAVIPPIIAELYVQGKKPALERMLRGTAFIAGVPALLVLVSLVVMGDPILGLVYDDYYRQGATVLTVLSVGRLVAVLAGPCQQVLMMTGHQKILMRITLTTGFVNLLLAFLLVGNHGTAGVAAAAAVSLIFEQLVTVFIVRWRIGVWTPVGRTRHSLTVITEQFRTGFGRIVARGH